MSAQIPSLDTSETGDANQCAMDGQERRPTAKEPMIILEVQSAYNLDNMPMPKPNGPNGRRVLNLEMLMHHPFYWEWLNERETEEVLMEIYIARTQRTQ